VINKIESSECFGELVEKAVTAGFLFYGGY
jgi:hypothetical protein